MGRGLVVLVEKKTRIVLGVVAGEVSVAEAARRGKVFGQAVGKWKRRFLVAGETGLAAGESGLSSREEQLGAEVAGLTQALGGAAVEIRVWKKSVEGRLGSLRALG